jgi:hypothetical protein
MSSSVATGFHRLVYGARPFCGLQGKRLVDEPALKSHPSVSWKSASGKALSGRNAVLVDTGIAKKRKR